MNWICRQIAPSVTWLRWRLRRLLWSSSTAVEVSIAWATLSCGVQLARSERLFEDFPRHYAQLAAVAPEQAWASAMLVLGSALATSLLIGSRRARRILLMGLVLLWWALAGLFWSSLSGGLLPVLAAAVAFMCTWAFTRLGLPE